MPPDLPTAEQMFGTASPGGSKLTSDDIFGPDPSTVKSGPDQDSFFSMGTVGKVLDAFGQGAKHGWGTQSVVLSPENEKSLRDSGVWNDYQHNNTSFLKSGNEAWMRPAAAALDTIFRGVPAVVTGTEAALAQTGEEAQKTPLGAAIGAQELGQTLAEVAQYETSRGDIQLRPFTPADLAKARSLGAVGEGEAGYFDTRTATPETTQGRSAATKEVVDAQKEQAAEAGVPEGQQAAPAAQEPPDIHTVARQLAPETFQEYDALAARRDQYRTQLNELATQRAQLPDAVEAQGKIDTILSKVNGVEDRFTNAAAQRLDAARDDLDDILRKDTPEMADTRKLLLSNDFRMRDLAPQVAGAYRDAQAQIPEQPESVVQPEAPAPQETAPAEQPQAVPAEAAPGTPEPAAQPLGTTIAQDVSQKLVTAGRPQEEADAAAAIVQAHYEARAQRFGGQLGSAQELYARDAPNIKGAGRKRAVEMAQRDRILHQGLFNEEPGAVDANGNPLPQTIIPGTEQSAQQLAKAREAQGHGLKSTKAAQKDAGPLFGGTGASKDQGTLFQNRRGSITLGEARNTIKLFKDADASTAMHEIGHQWLEELMSDAADERAPADVKTDAKTVRDWLGAKDGEEIKRAQHEKFARGFERYLMEGVAPSKALASVFAKFRAWLTQIYQTVNKLRTPINDDIRAVFDRLISANPERTVIAPERPIETSMADIHEAEAEHTPAERAEPVADQIRSEIDAVAKEKAPDVHAELTSQTGPIAGENAAPASGADEGIEPATEESPTGIGEKPAGGNEAQTEGAKPRPESGTKPSSERVAGPNDNFAAPESNLVDKAGNIVLDNLNTNEDVKAVLRQVADMNDEFLSARRGVVSDADVMSYADAMGVKAREVNLKKLRAISLEDGIPLAARIRVGREMLVQSAQAVHDAMQGYDEMAYALTAQRHLMIQETLSAITAEVGRGLRAFRDLGDEATKAQNLSEFLKENTGRTLNQLKEEMAQGKRLDTPAKVSGYLKDVRKPSYGDMALEVFKNWLISGPITHKMYATGNTILAIWKAVPETAMEAAVGAIRGTEGLERVRFGEVGANLYGLFRGQRDGFKAAWDSFKAGQTMALPGEETPIAGKSTNLFTQTKAIPDFKVGSVPIPLGSAIRFPGERMVAPIHSYFRSINYSWSIAGQAYRAASEAGLRGDAFNQRIAELTTTPTLEMMKEAREGATQATLMGRGGELTKRVSALMNWEPKLPFLGETKPFAFVDPFVHIASNIVEQAVIERGPLGLMSSKIRDDLRGVNGEKAKNETIARMATGTALSIVGGGLAMEGLITPSEPSDPREAAMWRRVNGMPHSARFGDVSMDLSRLGVLGFLLGIAADLYHAGAMMGKEDKYKIASLLVHSFTQNFLDEGFMRGPSDLIKALDDNERYGASYFRNFVSTIAVPFSVGMSQIARQVDPYAREARTTMDAIKAKVPWWSETLMPRRDIWGEPMPNRDASLLGGYTQAISNDPVDKELMDVGVYPSKPLRKIRGVDLTDQQYDDYCRQAGRMAKMQLTDMVNMAGFSTLPVGVRQEMIKNVITASRENARSLVLMENPDLIQKAIDLKTAPLLEQEPAQ